VGAGPTHLIETGTLAKVVRIIAPATGSTFGWLCSEVARLVIGRALGL
jgi:hypothetical protein